MAPCAALQHGERLLARDRLAVWAVGGHRVEGVADRHDPRAEGDLLAHQPVRVAAAVVALVARADDARTPWSAGAADRIRSPTTVCSRMKPHSSSFSGPGFF